MNLLHGEFHLLDVPDLGWWCFLLEEISMDLASGHLEELEVDFMSIISGHGEAVSCTNDHTLGDDGTTADLLSVLVDAHVPRNQGHVRIFS